MYSVDKCFVPSDALHKCARDRKLEESQITQYGLPIREGFWATTDDSTASAFGKSGGGGLEDKLAEWFKFGGNKKENSGSGKKNNDKSALQSKLGIVQNVPTVLVVGGGDGMGGIIKTAQSLGNQLDADSDADSDKPSYQMVVVCGSNQKAKADLEAYPWGPGVNVCVNGFVNNMDEWMRASDAIVTKAGPGTIAEASICGLPCLLSAYL
jgi:1,2-diacylglycerol 3-beta-galactosyltransferase